MSIQITDANFHKFFHDVSKHERQEGEITVSYRSHMELPDCQLKRDVIKLLAEVRNGAHLAVEALCLYASASKQSAINLCGLISQDLMHQEPNQVASKPYVYESVLFFYIHPDHLPEAWFAEKNSRWAIVP